MSKKQKPLEFNFKSIGFIETPFKGKFGIPRQSGMVESARGTITLHPDEELRFSLRKMETFTHLWVIFVFHQTGTDRWRPVIRPPRLGGAKKVGVLASRSPHRPNPIGMSVVKIIELDLDHKEGARIIVEGVDLLDGTPIIDLKPYLPYADSIAHASNGWASEEIPVYEVSYSAKALKSISDKERMVPDLKNFIQGVIELDPRPASQKRKLPLEDPKSQGLEFGIQILDYDVQWKINQKSILVMDVIPYDPKNFVK